MKLLVGASGAVAWSSGFTRARSATKRASKTEPRYIVLLLLTGGIDAVYSTDPKTRRDVADGIDVPYGPAAIGETGAIRLGPHFAQLLKWSHKMAIVHGVRVHTANHQTGVQQAPRLRTRVTTGMPWILDIIGSQRAEQPLACIGLGPLDENEYSPNLFGGDLFAHLDRTDPDDLASMAAALGSNARRLRQGSTTAAARLTAERLREVQNLFAHLPKVTRFAPRRWPGEPRAAADLQRVLWAFENDVTRCAYVKCTSSPNWDSHSHNSLGQRHCTVPFAQVLDRFLSALETTTNQYGKLADNTLIIAASELGRFPRINSNAGKDHFPEAPYMFWGAGINTGDGKGAAYGRTGKMMEARPVDLRTGRDAAGGHYIELDDIGATMLQLTGLDPALYGYHGRILEFLL